jgi:hypothetical protein
VPSCPKSGTPTSQLRTLQVNRLTPRLATIFSGSLAADHLVNFRNLHRCLKRTPQIGHRLAAAEEMLRFRSESKIRASSRVTMDLAPMPSL